MTKGEALQSFFSQFLTAYASSAVPDDAMFPYLTYDLIVDSWDSPVSLTVNLWFYTASEAVPNSKVQEISEVIGRSGTIIPCDGGGIWLTRGSPWCQNLTEAADRNIKRRYMNVTAEYITND